MRAFIRTDGSIDELPERIDWLTAKRGIGAETIDIVKLRQFGELHVMMVNDHGYETVTVRDSTGITLKPVRALLPINAAATRLYHANCKPGVEHQIVGDVYVCPDGDYE